MTSIEKVLAALERLLAAFDPYVDGLDEDDERAQAFNNGCRIAQELREDLGKENQ